MENKLKIANNLSEWSSYSCQPTTRSELKKIIEDRIPKEGYECDLNDIDTSLIDDMSYLFYKSKFNGNISDWNVSNVKNMNSMFFGSMFNGNISKWDVSGVENMRSMFFKSRFNTDISNWDVSNVTNKLNVFFDCPIKKKFKPKFN